MLYYYNNFIKLIDKNKNKLEYINNNKTIY